MFQALVALYDRLTLQKPVLVGVLLALLLGGALYQARHFKLDASADSLVLEGDQDLAYYRTIRDRYGSDDFLVVTYSPQADLFSDEALEELKALRDELAQLDPIKSVTSILDVPLIDSPRVTLAEIQQGTRTLLDPDTDRALAKREFQTSPLYRDLIMNRDGTTTAMLLTLETDTSAEALLQRREELRAQRDSEGLSDAEATELERVSAQYAERSAELQRQRDRTIDQVRAVLDRHRDQATIFLGGVPMIASDMIDFVRGDIRTFGIGVALFIILLLAVSFRRLRWVVVPTMICGVSAILMVGMLGALDWRVTVVSSNFISLMLILTLSLTIHLVERQRELHAQLPEASQADLLRQTVHSKFTPSLYTALTTMVSFAALAVCDVQPVIDFGLMMTWGVLIAFLVTFIAYPAALVRLGPGLPPAPGRDFTARLNRGFARIAGDHPRATAAVYALLVVAGIAGIMRLTVENRFIDYFHESTEIYQGMALIDQELGGTTPVDIVLDAPAWYYEEQAEDAEFALPTAPGATAGMVDSYWYNSFRQDELRRIHEYLESLPETGKVLSVHTSLALVTQINGDRPLDNFAMAVMYSQLPDEVKAAMFDPYLSDDGNQVRFAVRVIDSAANLNRNELLKKIRRDLIEQFELEPEQVHLTGMLVLYNNVTQSLFRSQALTVAVVFAAIGLMFWGLFRSPKMGVIGLLPTLVAAGLILGVMGWLGVPLDIMTITIAAITIGIGVHDTIHYTHRFREEIRQTGDYKAAVLRSHGSVGRAMAYTTIVITLGFSILALSNFVPTIYFGLFTGLAMVLALVANLTLLPILLMALKPFPAPSRTG